MHALPTACEPALGTLNARVDAARWRLAAVRAADWALAALAAGFGGLAVGLALAAHGPLRPGPYAAWLGVLGATVGALLALAGLRVLRRPGRREAALRLERCFPQLDDRLATALDMHQRRHAPPFSAGLMRALVLDAERVAAELDVTEAMDGSTLRRAAAAAGAAVVLCVMVAAAAPGALGHLTSSPQPVTPAAARGTPGRAFPTPGLGARRAIADVRVEIDPPAYTGLTSLRVPAPTEPLSAPAGSRVRVSARVLGVARPVLECVAERAGPAITQMAVGPAGEAAAGFVLERTVRWRLLPDAGTDTELATRPHEIRAIADDRPVVRITEPGRDLALTHARPVALALAASDDYGVASMALMYRLSDDKDWRRLPIEATGGRDVATAFVLDLAPLRLPPGGTVWYRAVATDNDGFRGPKAAYSRTYAVRLRGPAMGVQASALEQAQTREAQTLEELREHAEQLGQQIDELLKQAKERGGQDLTGPQVARLAEAARRADDLAGELDRAIGETMRQMAADRLVTAEMMSKVARLQQLLQETLNEDLRRALEEVQKALGAMDARRALDALQAAQLEHSEFKERLDRTIALLEQARLEQRLARAAELARWLVERQEGIEAATEAAAEKERLAEADRRALRTEAERQEGAADDAERLTSEMAELAGALAQSHPEAAKRLQEVGGDLEALRPEEQMRAAARELAEARPRAALPPERSALQALRLSASALREAEAHMLGQFRRELSAALRRLLRDALYLSEHQEELMHLTQPIGQWRQQPTMVQKRQLERLAQRQRTLAEGSQGLSRQFAALARKTPLVPPRLKDRADDVAEVMAQAGRDIQGGAIPQALGRQRAAMGQLNDLGRQLLEMTEGAAAASQSMALEQYLKQLEALAQQQKSLNRQTEQAVGDGLPVPGPGSPSLERLAAQQELIRRALEKLLRQAEGGQGNLGEQLGNVPGQMEDVEEDLAQYTAGRETLRTQAEILRRMLDAQRSLQTKAERPERKAVQARPYEAPPSPPKLKPSAPAQVKAPATGPEQPLPFGYEELARQYLEAIGQ